MEDKRILKTKEHIKRTFIKLLGNTSFNKISVTDLCKAANTARITFYTHYPDKFALVDEMMDDYYQDAYAIYHELEKTKNPMGDGLIGYEHLLECILQMYDEHLDFFQYVSPETNPYLYSAFYQKIAFSVEDYMKRHTKGVVPRYASDQMAALLCGGLWAVIHKSYASGLTRDAAHDSIRKIYQTMLSSTLFMPSTLREWNA